MISFRAFSGVKNVRQATEPWSCMPMMTHETANAACSEEVEPFSQRESKKLPTKCQTRPRDLLGESFKVTVKWLLFSSEINRQSGVISRKDNDYAIDRTTKRATDRAK
jgi:hypothetical protein